jgi:hypothetical protein
MKIEHPGFILSNIPKGLPFETLGAIHSILKTLGCSTVAYFGDNSAANIYAHAVEDLGFLPEPNPESIVEKHQRYANRVQIRPEPKNEEVLREIEERMNAVMIKEHTATQTEIIFEVGNEHKAGLISDAKFLSFLRMLG